MTFLEGSWIQQWMKSDKENKDKEISPKELYICIIFWEEYSTLGKWRMLTKEEIGVNSITDNSLWTINLVDGSSEMLYYFLKNFSTDFFFLFCQVGFKKRTIGITNRLEYISGKFVIAISVQRTKWGQSMNFK